MSTHAQSIYEVFDHQKPELVLHLLTCSPDLKAVMVFVRTRDGVHALTSVLNQSGIMAESVHGNKKPELRDRSIKALVDHKLRVLVTTNSMVRDLEISGVGHVIHVDFPELDSDYTRSLEIVQSPDGQVITLVSPKDAATLNKLGALLGEDFPRKTAEGSDDAAQPTNVKPTRKKGGTSKGLRSKPLQNKKPKFKNKRGR